VVEEAHNLLLKVRLELTLNPVDLVVEVADLVHLQEQETLEVIVNQKEVLVELAEQVV
tara:strand:+ start:782 stop:955 length:174 start_codon:yes stop_codon:yes gene_type:complete